MSSLTVVQKGDDFHWPVAGESGKVPITCIAPNPNNARKHFDPIDLRELADSIREGGQREVATVRLPWAHEKYGSHIRYVIVSGERRWQASQLAGSPTYDIRVRHYKNEADEGLEGFILNKNRVDLTDIEKAWEVERLTALHGWKTQDEIAQKIGESRGWVAQMASYLRASPKVLARVHPSVPDKDRLTKNVVLLLSPRPIAVQDAIIERMPSQLVSGTAQMAWIRKQLELNGIEIEPHQRTPITLRRILASFAETTLNRLTTLEASDMTRLFENTSDREARMLASDLKAVLTTLTRVVAVVEKAASADKRQTMLIARTALPAQDARVVSQTRRAESVPVSMPSPSKPAVAPIPSAPKPSAHVPPSRDSTLDAVVMNIREVQRPSVPSSSGRMVNVAYKSAGGGFKSERVTLKRYKELSDQKLLMYQVQGEKRPGNYPDPATICG